VDLGLANKTAVVTGGSGMIGQGLVLEFAREGMNVVSASRDVTIGETLVQRAAELQLAGNILPVATDVTQRESVDAMIEQCHQVFGPVDVLVNNAGGMAQPIAFEQMDEQAREWEKSVNIDGVVNCCQAVADDMLGRKTGSIINISSNSSLVGDAAVNLVHYGAVKGFVNSFSKSLAYEWAEKGVRVNTISPAWIVPESDKHIGEGSFWNKFGFFLMGRPDEIRASFELGTLDKMSGLPMPRLGSAEDIANLSLFLASEKAGYITGQLISVSGGAYMP
jgi:2-hydroxycyclohexanecarboxyl-CoA dehydrogenase